MMRTGLMLLLCLLMSAPAGAQDDLRRIGAFVLPDDFPDTIILADEITEATPLEFFRALQARPNAKTIALLSGGGSVYGALTIAIQVHERGMTTVVPKSAWCYSACAYIFFAGRIRKLEGELGVHQISTDGVANIAGAQTTIADILEALNTFDVDPGVLGFMFRTAADDIHVFSATEIAQFGIESPHAGDMNSDSQSGTAAPVEQAKLPPPAASVPSAPNLPDNVTIVAQNSTSDVGRFERLITVVEPVGLAALLRRNGFPDLMIQAIDAVVTHGNFFDMGVLPKDMQILVLFGPARSSDDLIPYRLSFFAPSQDSMAHYATVVLSDRGQFILGREPGQGNDRLGETSSPGKQDRAL